MSKPFWESKTFWINIIALVLVILAEIVKPAYCLPASVVQVVALVTPILNIILRFLSEQQITLTRQN